MKRLLILLMSFLMIMTLAACGSKSNNEIAEETQNESAEEVEEEAVTEEEDQASIDSLADQAEDESKMLVIYFSRTGEQYRVGTIEEGNTAIVAKIIAEEIGADLYEVLPEDDYYPYTYDELTDVAKQEQNENARPPYKKDVPDLSAYETVFIGAPVWWGDWPMIMYTFFENEDLSQKTLIPFSTHEGSGLSGFDSKLAKVCSDSEVLDGLAIRGEDAQNNRDSVAGAIKEWLSELGY